MIKSLTTRLRAKFNVTVAEATQQDNHQIIVLAVAALAADTGQADSILAAVQKFILLNTDAEMIGLEEELR